jgi:hypothetical protein
VRNAPDQRVIAREVQKKVLSATTLTMVSTTAGRLFAPAPDHVWLMYRKGTNLSRLFMSDLTNFTVSLD